MVMSVFDLFKIGIGPSSSHTVGPMHAANHFLSELDRMQILGRVASIYCEFYGSLAQTGIGHGTDRAVILGLMGERPEHIHPEQIEGKLEAVYQSLSLSLAGQVLIAFDPGKHLLFKRRQTLPQHSNGMRFYAYDGAFRELLEKTYYSVGGGLVHDEQGLRINAVPTAAVAIPYPFSSAADLIALSERHGLSIADIMLKNESCWRSVADISGKLEELWYVMKDCMDRGFRMDGILPGKLKLKRRAPDLYADLLRNQIKDLDDPLTVMDWVNLYALAVSEENAAGSRVVTAPTNGAAGIIPAVLRYYEDFCPGAHEDGIQRFFLTAAAIGMLYVRNASISGAAVGCQGEVGVACSMAAAGLAAALNADTQEIAEAAEIGMEHNLGLTCDPIGGLVQVPCIERNAMGAIKAINACRLAMRRKGMPLVSLDAVIRTMRATGADMKTQYKETSRGGLAVNVTEC